MKERVRRLWGRPAFRAGFYGFLALVVLFLWWGAVRRAMAGPSSQINDFIPFGEDLVLRRVNVYEAYEPTYTITKYPPFFGILFVPLAAFPMAIAASLWFCINLGLSVVAARIGVQVIAENPGTLRQRPALIWIPYAMTAPIIISNLETSQVNIVIVALSCWTLWLYRSERDGWSGIVLGLAAAIKLTPGLFILYFLRKRAWRVVAGAVAGLLIGWVVIPLAVFGWEYFREVHLAWAAKVSPFLSQGTRAEGVGGFRHTNQSLSAVLHRTLAHVPAGAERADFYVNLVSLKIETVAALVRVADFAILAALAWICGTSTEDRRHVGLGLEFALIMIAMLFLSPISWINHYVILLFPYIVAVHYVATRPAGVRERRFLRAATMISFALLLTSVSRLLQAFSLPFLGAAALAAGLVAALYRERAAGRAKRGGAHCAARPC